MTSAHTSRPGAGPAPILGAALFGAVVFASVAGTRLLDPTSIEWLMKGDWVPHYFGWHFFRIEPWHWPPGRVHGYYAPLGTSIGLTDSIPLLAYLLKPLSSWLPAHFQYLGLWLLFCFAMQGALGARLVGRFGAPAGLQFIGGCLFVLLPTLLARVAHAALCGHWLILWALLVATRDSPRRHQPVEWGALGLTAGLVNPYLAAMVLGLLAAATASGSTGSRRRIVALAGGAAAMAGGWWLSGIFVLGSARDLGEGGLGYYSLNLAGFVAPSGWSRFIPDIPLATEGQPYESFHYLGLGMLALVVVAAGLHWRAGTPAHRAVWPRPLLAMVIAMAVFALSPLVTIGPVVIADLRGAWSDPLAVFRASGRFAWPLSYVIAAGVIGTVARQLPARTAGLVLTVALLLQGGDLYDAFAFRGRAARDPAFHRWTNPFEDPGWPSIARAYGHIELVPPPQCGEAPVPYEPVVRLAAEYGLTVNAGVVARADTAARSRYCSAADAAIDRVALRDDTVYLVSARAATILSQAGGPARVSCGGLGAVWLCTTADSRARWAHVLLQTPP